MSFVHTFKKIVKILLILLGVLMLFVIGLGTYFYFADPLGLFNRSSSDQSAEIETNQSGDKHPMLNTQQENILEKIGVDVESLPTEITPQMEACFVEELGQERVNEITEGDSPGVLDYMKAKNCINN